MGALERFDEGEQHEASTSMGEAGMCTGERVETGDVGILFSLERMGAPGVLSRPTRRSPRPGVGGATGAGAETGAAVALFDVEAVIGSARGSIC